MTIQHSTVVPMFLSLLFISCTQTDTKNQNADVAEPTPDVTEPSEPPVDTDTDAPIDPDDSGSQPDTSTPEDTAVPEDPAEREGWDLVWRDEFEGSDIDLSLWSFEVNAQGGGNNEAQYYTDRSDNARIENGALVIEARSEQYTGGEGTRDYTSARLRTKYKGDWLYGRFEARIRLPEGQGIWPAFWMLPTDNVYGTWPASGEIDIMELVGHESNVVHGTLHYGGIYPHHTYTGDSVTITDPFSADFHTFAVEWEPGEIRWYVDEQHTQTQTSWYTTEGVFPAPFDQRFHLILNVAVGGNWPGYPDSSTQFPQQMVVDYVRVYQLSDSSPEPEPEPEPGNLLSNEGFENAAFNGAIWAPDSWLIYPTSLSNFNASENGEAIYNSSAVFQSQTGQRALKVYGQFSGFENRTPVYQEFPAQSGETFSLDVYAYTHIDDRINGTNRANAFIAFFNGNYDYLGGAVSNLMTPNSPTNVWTLLTTSAAAPAGTTLVQAGIEYMQCEGQQSGQCYDAGSVYFDDATFTKQ